MTELVHNMSIRSSSISNATLNSSIVDPPVISRLQFLDKGELLLKVSKAVIEDFYQNVSEFFLADSDIKHTKNLLQSFIETCDYPLKNFAEFSTKSDDSFKRITTQLTLERCSYDLILRILCPDIVDFNRSEASFLLNTLKNNERFRRIMLLLKWTEDNGKSFPTEFSRICDDAHKLNNLENIYACSMIRGSTHIDSRFTDRIAAEDEESVNIFNRTLFSLLRTGQTVDAKGLIQGLSLHPFFPFIVFGEFLSDSSLSVTNPEDSNYNLAKSKIFFKQLTREIISTQTGDERIQMADHCIWATLSSHLPTLLTYANSAEDRLWAYLSCAAGEILDNELLKVHSRDNGKLNAIFTSGENEDVPKDVQSIFQNLIVSDKSPYFGIYGKIALEDWAGVVDVIAFRLENASQGADSDELPPHELRFYAHLVLLAAKLNNGEISDRRTFDKVILRYVDLLVRLPSYTLVPFYLFQLTDKRVAKNKLIDTLERIRDESEQKEALERAVEAGFETADLCRDVFERFKNKYPLPAREDNQCSKSIFELLHAWKWLTHCGAETIWDALSEANYILRKLFILHRMTSALDFMSMVPENLLDAAVSFFKLAFPGDEKLPEKLDDAKREYECYFLYFDAIDKYNAWQKHFEGKEPPKPPPKLTDEAWSRLDIRRRAEYELSVQKSRECLQDYLSLSEMLKKTAVESLERLLINSDGWLVTLSADDEDNSDAQQIERARDFRELRKHYFFNILKLIIDVHSKSDEPMKVVELTSLIMDPRYNIHKALTQDLLRQLLSAISLSGAVLD